MRGPPTPPVVNSASMESIALRTKGMARLSNGGISTRAKSSSNDAATRANRFGFKKTWSESLVPFQLHSAKLSFGKMEIEPGDGGISCFNPSYRWFSFSGGRLISMIECSGNGSRYTLPLGRSWKRCACSPSHPNEMLDATGLYGASFQPNALLNTTGVRGAVSFGSLVQSFFCDMMTWSRTPLLVDPARFGLDHRPLGWGH